jgi:uncharacterized membrane protein YjjP (DUF1212 family)
MHQEYPNPAPASTFPVDNFSAPGLKFPVSVFNVHGINHGRRGPKMNLKKLGELNNDRFLREAFDANYQKKLIQAARFHRNLYLVLFLVGFACIFIASLVGLMLLSILSLFLATLSLVVMTKYDTQVFFLKIIASRSSREA